MNYQETYNAIKSADISVHCWAGDIIDKISSDFARGYLTCRLEGMLESREPSTESFRRCFLSAVKAYIFS